MPKSRLTRGLREQIAVELRSDIVAGRFAPGVQMVERQLAQRFGVSHAPIREALLQLAHEGLLVAQTNRGAQVAPSVPPDTRRFFLPIRKSLEIEALRLALPKLTETDFAAWEAIAAAQASAYLRRDPAAIAEYDFQFHQVIVDRSAQHDLIACWRTIVARARRYVNEWLPAEEPAIDLSPEHSEVAAHCRAGNFEQATQALEANLDAELNGFGSDTYSTGQFAAAGAHAR